MTLEEIRTEALNLPHESRARLVESLMATLVESPDSEVEQAWYEEAERRRQQLLDGSVQGIPAEEVFAKLSAKYQLPRTGADLVAYWQEEGLVGTRPESTDSESCARDLRREAEWRKLS